MITTDAPAWLRRSDQAVTWARTMLQPRRAVVIDCETTDLPGGVTGNDGYQNLRIPNDATPLTENPTTAGLSASNLTERPRNGIPDDAGFMHLKGEFEAALNIWYLRATYFG